MKDYIKPIFVLAEVSPRAMTSNNCDMTESELQNFVDFAEMNFDFSSVDSCKTTNSDLDVFCKFTSTEVGFFKVIGS